MLNILPDLFLFYFTQSIYFIFKIFKHKWLSNISKKTYNKENKVNSFLILKFIIVLNLVYGLAKIIINKNIYVYTKK